MGRVSRIGIVRLRATTCSDDGATDGTPASTKGVKACRRLGVELRVWAWIGGCGVDRYRMHVCVYVCSGRLTWGEAAVMDDAGPGCQPPKVDAGVRQLCVHGTNAMGGEQAPATFTKGRG